MTDIRATPFHAGAAEANRFNRWTERNGFTLAASYEDAAREAMAARFGVVMADISWRWRVMLEGEWAAELGARLFTRNVAALTPGEAIKACWLTDAGGVRGAGVVARHGRNSFMLTAAARDAEWIQGSSELFGVATRDVTETEAGLALIGPRAQRLVAELGLDATLAPLAFRKLFWRGLDITLSRFGEHGGFEIWCGADDASIVWDRVLHAGRAHAILPGGVEAMDILDIEAGVPRPGRDYDGATRNDDNLPLPASLRLRRLIDEAHPEFNGHATALAAASPRTLVGVELDSERPAPFAPLCLDGKTVGRTLSSCYSPALRRAIALAQVDHAHATAGTSLVLTPASSRVALQPAPLAAGIVDLPFLPVPDSILS